MPSQAELFIVAPPGLSLEEDFLSPEDEREILAILRNLDWREVRMRGQVARRRTRHYGLDYGYESARVSPTDPVPPWLDVVRDRAARWAGDEPGRFVEVLCSFYPEGAGIGWHRDAPAFGAPVIGVSLGSPCRMRFQSAQGSGRRTAAIVLPPRSIYRLDGPARWDWQHAIPPVASPRWSLTFRPLRTENDLAENDLGSHFDRSHRK